MDYKESFLQYLKIEKRYSPHTVRSYRNDLDQFSTFLEQNDIPGDPSLVSFHQVRAWIVSLMENGTSPVTVHRKISCLRVFFKYLQKEGHIKSNPVEKVVLPKRKKYLPSFVGEKSIDNLLDGNYFGEDFDGIRNRTLIEMFNFTGMRRAELREMKIADVDLEKKEVKVTGKRNKQRIIPLAESFIPQIIKYITIRNDQFGDAGGWFFLTGKGNKLYDRYVYNIVRGYLSEVTTNDKKSPHVLRHTFATHMLNHGANLDAIKELLGHANLSATQIYTHNTFEKIRSVYKDSHPRERKKKTEKTVYKKAHPGA